MAERIDPAPIAETLKALAHPIRLMILQELVDGTKCVTDMEELLPAKQANISQHLAVLRNAKLVDFAQDGALRCYYLARPKLVRDILRLVSRDEPAVKRTADQIKMEKERADRVLARPAI
ncbi:MAG: ArsR/SmtB family transcription factor [Thermoguttaceae bacterium]